MRAFCCARRCLPVRWTYIRTELDTNLFGIIRVARTFAPILAGHASSSMVNVLSALSWLTLGGGHEISKSAAWSANNALRFQMAPQGTRVTALHVGFMDTDMVAALDVPKADPREVARLTADAPRQQRIRSMLNLTLDQDRA